MYVLFWSPLIKLFLIRYAASSEDYVTPDDEYDGMVCVDDSVEGYLDTFALVVRKAREEGWKNYEVKVEGCP